MGAEETRETLEFDVLFIGGGPAGLSGMIHLLKQAREKGIELEVGMIDKGGSPGAHLLSGALIDLRALEELIPDYAQKNCPIEVPEFKDNVYYLTENKAFPVPFAHKVMNSEGCAIISISKFASWLSEQAEELGANIFPGFSGVKVLYDESGKIVTGIRTGDMGVNKQGEKKANYEPGIDILAKVTVFGEGAKGSLFRELDEKFNLTSSSMPQVFKTSFKEVVKVEDTSVFPDGVDVVHTTGYPLDVSVTGGGFVYRMSEDLVSIGFVVGLDYEDPMFEPHDAFLKFKQHPLIYKMIQGGKVTQQGAKILPSGGYYAVPKIAVDGALVIGDSAGLLNTQRLKGIHTAMKSGMLAAETVMEAFERNDFSVSVLTSYPEKVRESWINSELFPARNFTQALGKPSLPSKMLHLAAQQITNGRGIIDPMKIEADYSRLSSLKNKTDVVRVNGTKPKTDSDLFIDKLTGVYLSGTLHEEDQPCHLKILDQEICITRCAEQYDFPCVRFCPGNVYETKEDPEKGKVLHLNPSNCLHCKTCEIKDPFKNILWTCPEGGGGPSYTIV